MLKVLKTYFFVFFGLSLNAQPEINEWYSFGRTQSVFGSIVATDSCYYAIGLGASTVPEIWDAGFFKLDLNGNIIDQSFLHSDTVSINHFSDVGTNLVQTMDANFAALAVKSPYYMFIKYAPNGDTLFTSTITDFYVNDNLRAVQPGMIIELNEDSSFTCTGWISNIITLKSAIIIFNLSKSGALNYYEFYYSGHPDYSQHLPSDLIRIADGYLISSYIAKVGVPNIDERQHTRITKTNLLGQLVWSTTDWTNLLDQSPIGFSKTDDGGYIYGGITGWYIPLYNGHLYKGHIIKLDSNFDFEWEIEVGDSSGQNFIELKKIVNIDQENYVAAGYMFNDSMKCGWLFKFNLDGQVIWDSYFSYVPDSSPNSPDHRFYDIKQTSDNGFVIVGEAWDVQTTFEGNPGSFAWLVKTDSVGCLVPGCQDFLEIESGLQPTIKLDVFPNPSSNVLNIYYYDSNFSGNAEIMIYDMHGRIVKSWKLLSNDMTYIYDVSGLVTGVYVLEVFTDGKHQSLEKIIVNH